MGYPALHLAEECGRGSSALEARTGLRTKKKPLRSGLRRGFPDRVGDG